MTFTPESRIIDVVQKAPAGRDLLYRHGYRLGEGFVDALSQMQTLEEAETLGRLRSLPELLAELNAQTR